MNCYIFCIFHLFINCIRLYYIYCRLAKFEDMAAKGVIDPSKLPPTSSTAYQHNLRVFYQCWVWKTLEQQPADPLDWGWKQGPEGLTPIMTLKECAPSGILNFIRCKCKTGCASRVCSCRNHGLSCVHACSNGRGDCENSEVKSKLF